LCLLLLLSLSVNVYYVFIRKDFNADTTNAVDTADATDVANPTDAVDTNDSIDFIILTDGNTMGYGGGYLEFEDFGNSAYRDNADGAYKGELDIDEKQAIQIAEIAVYNEVKDKLVGPYKIYYNSWQNVYVILIDYNPEPDSWGDFKVVVSKKNGAILQSVSYYKNNPE